MNILFSAKDFQSGLDTMFSIYDLAGNLIDSLSGKEIGSLGIYYISIVLNPFINYVIIAEDGSGWKAFKYVPSRFHTH